jgi:hypothetical protein
MGNVILPTIIQGPAVISHGGAYIYVQKDVDVDEIVESWNPETSEGPMGERYKSRMFRISCTPRGNITEDLLDYYYAAILSPSTTVGRSIISGALVIYSIAEGKTYSYNKAGLSKPPDMMLSPTSQAFGQVQWDAIGDWSKQPTVDAVFKTVATAANADTSFEDTDVVTDIYSAAFGARTAPYAAVGALDGFAISFGMSVKTIADANVGIADVVMEGLSMGMSFTPNSLTEAEVDVLLGLQNTGAIIPGQPFGDEDVVLTGTQSGWVFTLPMTGGKRSPKTYQVGEHRFKAIEFASTRTWTSGVADPLFAYTAPA